MAFLNESHIEGADIDFFLKQLDNNEHSNAWEKKLVGRINLKDVVLRDRLKEKLIDLNPSFPQDRIDQAVYELCKSRATHTLVIVNKYNNLE
jgi:type I restriction enzyme, R subunit